ncbi:MAG: hypothetical protein HYU43_07615, partial [Armatimonadetes bacterium]|nr:hypothetical protein [Armatimonadota bacterium]
MALILVLAVGIAYGCKKKEEAKPAPAGPSASGGQAPAEPAKPAVELGDPVPTLTVVGPSEAWSTSQYETNRFLAQLWEKELGIKLEIATYPDYASLIAALAPEKRDKVDIVTFGYVERYSRVDPDELLSRPLMCKGSANFGEYCNPKYDDLVKKSQVSFNVSDRQKLVHQAQEILLKDLPVVVQYHPTTVSMYNKKYFSNVITVPAGGMTNVWNWTRAKPQTDDKVMRYATQRVLRSIHPMNHLDYGFDVNVSLLVYDTLTRMAPDGSAVPWLASEWQSLDEKTLRVKLRQDAKFHDGKPVTAEDIKFAYEYLKKWEIGMYKDPLKPIESVVVVDTHTVDLKLTTPSATLLTLSLGQIPIVPKHIWDGAVERQKLSHPKDWANAPLIGSGQYKVETVQAGVGVKLARNTSHWEPPVPEVFEVRKFDDSRTAFNALLNQSVYFLDITAASSPAEIDEAKKKDYLDVVAHQSIT